MLKSVAAVNVLDTGDGLAMLDTGGNFDSDHVFDSVRAWRPDERVAAAIYSHHHIDHVFGTIALRCRSARSVAGRGLGSTRTRTCRRTSAGTSARSGWNTAINQRQFGLPISGWSFPDAYRYPDETYADRHTFRQGELTFPLHHALGETDDATWTWVPERKILHPGDLFIWAVPNAGNPQKVQRFASDWAAAALRDMAALEPETMLCGHGMPIFGRDRIQMALLDTAELLDAMETRRSR